MPGARESARYLDFADGQIYTVTHASRRARRGTVLLCSPFGVERERAYLTVVLWARTLAASGFDVMRFDYRGNGESTGAFEDMTIAHWREDAARCAARLAAAPRRGALLLHGIRFGALIAAELFAAGVGDGLLMWAPPVSAEALLWDTLRQHLIAQRMADPHAPPRVREQLIAELEAGEQLNVDGYFWTRALWKEAQQHPLCLPTARETRPWHALQTQGRAVVAPQTSAPTRPEPVRPEIVDADTFWSSSSTLLVPHSWGFFQASTRWLDAHEPWIARRA